VAVELAEYLRGRKLGDVSRIIKEQGYDFGLNTEQVITANSPVEGTAKVLRQLQPGDLALLLVLADREQVFTLIEQFSN
jgi:hypothetical protein